RLGLGAPEDEPALPGPLVAGLLQGDDLAAFRDQRSLLERFRRLQVQGHRRAGEAADLTVGLRNLPGWSPRVRRRYVGQPQVLHLRPSHYFHLVGARTTVAGLNVVRERLVDVQHRAAERDVVGTGLQVHGLPTPLAGPAEEPHFARDLPAEPRLDEDVG